MLAQETRPLSPSDPYWVRKIPQPKFKIGQQVQYSWTCDDDLDKEQFGKTFTDYGFVIGCWFAEQEIGGNGLVLKWVYSVFFDYLGAWGRDNDELPVNSFMRLGEVDQDELAEIDLNPD
jgi:hypothetical protein